MEWIGVLCTFLTRVCDIQLIIVGTLPFVIPKVLWLTGTHLSTCAGLMASLVVMVTIQLLKAGKTSSNTARIYKCSLLCRRLAICIAGAFHLIAIALTIFVLIVTTDLCRDFKKLMINYHSKYSSKALIDNIQFVLQCCGGHDYQDWFHIEWGAYQRESKRKKLSSEELLKEDTDVYVDSTVIRDDAVPFSCCARSVPSACVHQNLVQLGISTINVHGCGKRLRSSAQALLWFEFVVYSLSFALETAVFVLLSKQTGSEKSKSLGSDRKYEEFANNNHLSASHTSSSHSRSSTTSSSALHKTNRKNYIKK